MKEILFNVICFGAGFLAGGFVVWIATLDSAEISKMNDEL